MRSGKSSPQDRCPKRTELRFRVPPLGEVHLAEASDDDAKFEEPIEIDGGGLG